VVLSLNSLLHLFICNNILQIGNSCRVRTNQNHCHFTTPENQQAETTGHSKRGDVDQQKHFVFPGIAKGNFKIS